MCVGFVMDGINKLLLLNFNKKMTKKNFKLKMNYNKFIFIFSLIIISQGNSQIIIKIHKIIKHLWFQIEILIIFLLLINKSMFQVKKKYITIYKIFRNFKSNLNKKK